MSLHIALVLPYSLDHPGGVAQHCLGLARWLTGRGYQIEVVAPGTQPLNESFPLHLLGRAHPLRFNGSTAHLALGLQQSRSALTIVTKADLVHVHEPLTPGIAYRVARTRMPLVVTHHATYPEQIARLIYPIGVRLPRRVALAVSPTAADTAYAATGRRPRVVPNGIELPSLLASGREPWVIFLGRRDDPRKGYASFGQLARSMPQVRFIALGPGQTHEPGVEELGHVDEGTKHQILSRAQVLVAPHGFGESFGMVLVEALAFGCAIVGYGLAAFRAVNDDPAVTTWVPVGDLAALRRALHERLEHPVDPQIARAAAVRFGWDEVGPRVEDAYRAALAGHDIG